MGYTRTFNKTIEVSGSVSASYPASEHGGSHTVNYHESVPVTINIHVNTDPFDDSVDGANKTIHALTGAVVGMEAAQCKAIINSSEKISDKIIDGFYNLINSEMSMQKSESSSVLQSKFALMTGFAKDIVDKHQRMISDLERLRSHYHSIFKGLDEDLEKRVKALDKNAVYLSENVHDNLISQPYTDFGALGLGQITENNRSVGLITLARLRKKVSDVIDVMSQTAINTVEYKKNVSEMSWSGLDDTEGTIYVPAVYFFTNDGVNYFLPEINSKEMVVSKIDEYFNRLSQDDWKEIPENEMEMINLTFDQLIEQNFTNEGNNNLYKERVCKKMLELWQQNKPGITKA